ncbi:MAG: rhodanese-like domain-containing protein [Thermodesulfobacteriota bacterium]|nr:rhodanese-like domain-containing protein [Thermodesulfobacteriota bacterium]
MLRIRTILVLTFALVFVFSATAGADFAYKAKIKGHAGGDVSPTEALRMVIKDKGHTFIVDVRTRPEYALIGHPAMAYHVPLKLWTGKSSQKGYEMVINTNFGKNLKERFNSKTDTLIFMCRSGKRSCLAAEAAAKAGWSEDKLYNMLGGFEGDKVKCKFSAYNGQRKLGGWRNEGLPWTYKVDKKLAYPGVN